MLIVTHESHLDHDLTTAQLAWVLAQFKDAGAFAIRTVTLPRDLGTVPCNLHGPAMGDAPVPDVECHMAQRGKREVLTRVCCRAPRQTSILTVVMGPDDVGNPCVLYTVYGGPQAPREPGDPDIKTEEERAAARAFWARHALSD